MQVSDEDKSALQQQFRDGAIAGSMASMVLVLILGNFLRMTTLSSPQNVATHPTERDEHAIKVLEEIKSRKGVVSFRFTDKEIEALQETLRSTSASSVEVRRFVTKLLNEAEKSKEK